MSFPLPRRGARRAGWVFLPLLLSLTLTLPSVAQAATPNAFLSAPSPNEEVVTLNALELIQITFLNRNNPDIVSKNIRFLEKLTPSSPTKSYEIFWRLSFFNYYYVYYSKGVSKEEKIARFDKGIEYAKKALKVNPSGIDALIWHAGNVGGQARLRGMVDSWTWSSAHIIQQNIQKILKIDPKNSDAYYMQSRLYQEAPPVISIGDPKKALESIQTAIRYNPNRLRNYVQLGRLYLKRNQLKDAKAAYEKVLALPDEPDRLIENQGERNEARYQIGQIAKQLQK